MQFKSMLSDREILENLKNGNLKIENFCDECMTPNGYDVRIDECLVDDIKTFNIAKNKFFIISTIEVFEFPKNMAGQIWLRTTYARKGIMVSGGLIDAGFRGNLNIFLYNAGDEILMRKNERIAQVVFFKLEKEAEKDYSKRSGHYQNQTGIIK
ncbi:MAG: dCTP deaminase [Thermoplasmata archaeon]